MHPLRNFTGSKRQPVRHALLLNDQSRLRTPTPECALHSTAPVHPHNEPVPMYTNIHKILSEEQLEIATYYCCSPRRWRS